MGNLTWPIAVSFVGLLIPLVAAYFQQVADRSSIRQLEHLADVATKSHSDDANGVVVKAVRALQIAHILELRRRLTHQEKKRALVQSLFYVVFTAVGVVSSFIALAGAVELKDAPKEIGVPLSTVLIIANGLCFIVTLLRTVPKLKEVFSTTALPGLQELLDEHDLDGNHGAAAKDEQPPAKKSWWARRDAKDGSKPAAAK